MKKIATIVILILLVSSSAFSQAKFGVKGGLNFNSFKDISGSVNDTWSNQTGYHFGVLIQTKVPIIGLGLQPELLFVRKGVENPDIPANSFYLDYLQLPINVQVGLDLLLFRPFIMVSPYISYAIGKGDMLENAEWDNLNRLDYGYGLGVGVDIWKLQVTGKYNWSMGKLQDATSTPINGTTLKNAKIQGFQLSVALLF
ncbi:MAG: porin family protein [Bacteroidales bacterium]|nr:porin family protein [Bacteroidales bacterium]